jgi:DNA ligase (NAD+)
VSEDRVKLLKKKLDYYDDLYYNKNVSEISDAEYDALKEEYLEAAGLDEYNYVPGKVSSDLPRIKHTVIIKSLDKVNSEEELRKEVERLWPVLVQPKIDGLTDVAYEDKHATRGTGKEGEDCTAGSMLVPGMKFGRKGMPVRSEVFLPISALNRINEERIKTGEKPFENTRNAAAGILRSGDPERCKELRYYAYNIPGSKETETMQLRMLHSAGFNIVPTRGGFKTVDEAVNFIINFDRSQLDFDIDGIVVKSDITNSLEVFGETGHHPKNAVAYKFKSQGAWATLKEVKWQTGRTGKVTPVAIFDGVKILGSTVGKATLNNIGYIEAKGIEIGMEIYVVKANDVIPAVLKARDSKGVMAKIEVPKECPVCGAKLKKVKDQHFCTGDVCPAKLTNMVLHMAQREALDIDGLGVETVDKMFDLEIIKEPTDIFKLEVDDILKVPGYAAKSAKTLQAKIQKSRQNVPLDRFLYAVGIPGVGRRATTDIANEFGSFANLVTSVKQSKGQCLLNVKGIGEKSVEAFCKCWSNMGKLFQYITPVDVVKQAPTLTGKSLKIVITGTLSRPRSQVEGLIKSKGHTLTGSVSGSTNYVVVGDAPGATKVDAAKAKGVPMITEDELMDILNKQ